MLCLKGHTAGKADDYACNILGEKLLLNFGMKF